MPKDRRTTTNIQNRANRKTNMLLQIETIISQAFKAWKFSVLSVHYQIKLMFTSKPQYYYIITNIENGAKK